MDAYTQACQPPATRRPATTPKAKRQTTTDPPRHPRPHPRSVAPSRRGARTRRRRGRQSSSEPCSPRSRSRVRPSPAFPRRHPAPASFLPLPCAPPLPPPRRRPGSAPPAAATRGAATLARWAAVPRRRGSQRASWEAPIRAPSSPTPEAGGEDGRRGQTPRGGCGGRRRRVLLGESSGHRTLCRRPRRRACYADTRA